MDLRIYNHFWPHLLSGWELFVYCDRVRQSTKQFVVIFWWLNMVVVFGCDFFPTVIVPNILRPLSSVIPSQEVVVNIINLGWNDIKVTDVLLPVPIIPRVPLQNLALWLAILSNYRVWWAICYIQPGSGVGLWGTINTPRLTPTSISNNNVSRINIKPTTFQWKILLQLILGCLSV